MGKIWIKELTGGLDTRRMPVTTSGAVLMEAMNGHITRGGEFEKREAFVNTHVLPGGRTVGLAAGDDGLYVFGHQAEPELPTGIKYQRLQHPTDTSQALTKILCWDLYAGKLYVTAEFENGTRFMFYDGDYVESWADGFARRSFTVDSNEITPAVRASMQFRITPGTGSGRAVTSVKVDGKELVTTTPITYFDPHEDFVQAVVDELNTNTHGFTATRRGWRVILRAPAGEEYNDEEAVVAITGSLGITSQTVFSGGVDPIVPTLSRMWVGDQRIISAPVLWVTDANAMAAAIAAAVVAYSGTSDFTATASGKKVTVRALTAGGAANGDRIKATLANGLTLTGLGALSGGTTKALPRGAYNRTVGQKEYAVAGSVLYFSGIAAPSEWTTDAVGAGFIDMATEISGTERLQAVVKYQNYLAIFAEETTVIEYVDPDPALNRQVQVLQKTGTIAPLSVTQFGDRDIYYLDQTGLRSLQARDASNAAATTDIGVMVDSLVLAKLRTLSVEEKSQIIGAIEPQEGRFWLIMKDEIFVFSYFQGSKVSAWSTYTTTFFNDEGQPRSFDVEYAATYNKRLYLRASERIFAYGGGVFNEIYDATPAQARIPYLDANDPARSKTWTGIDAAVKGAWEIRIAMDPNNEATSEVVANITKTVYDVDKIPTDGDSTHISLIFKSSGSGRAVLSSCVIHYEGDQVEDR